MKNVLLFFIVGFIGFQIHSQTKQISGIISDENGLPLPGVNVLIKGTTNGTQTNFDGEYTITTQVGDILVYTFVGYLTKEKTIGKNNVISFSMELDVSAIDEVVVTAMGIKHSRKPIGYKSGATGSSSRIVLRGKSSISSPSGMANHTPQSGQLTAGEINDLEDWDEWLSILNKNHYKTIQNNWEFNLTNKIDIVVKTENGLPAVNAVVFLYDENNQLLSKAKTDATGKVSLFKPFLEKDNTCFIVQVVSGKSIIGKKIPTTYSNIEFSITKPKTTNDVDVMFTIDATGSMGDEMAYLKSELNNIMSRLDNDIEKKRVALTFYRDKGDAYLVKDFDFNSNIVEMQNILKSHHAGGGGDYEEAVEEALRVSIAKSWNGNAKSRILFLMLDAPPHYTENNVQIIKNQIQLAQEKGIKIIPIVASGANKNLEFLMRFFSVSTNGTYVFLTDDSGIGNPHLKPSKNKYNVEKLNDLIVRLIEKYSGVNS